MTTGIIVSDCHQLNLASEKVDLLRFDSEAPTRRLVKSIVLEENISSNVTTTKPSGQQVKREQEWIVAAAKECLGG
jgi:hypothetical protein